MVKTLSSHCGGYRFDPWLEITVGKNLKKNLQWLLIAYGGKQSKLLCVTSRTLYSLAPTRSFWLHPSPLQSSLTYQIPNAINTEICVIL